MKPRTKPPNPKNPIKPTRSTLARLEPKPKPKRTRPKDDRGGTGLFPAEQREELIRHAARLLNARQGRGSIRIAIDALAAELSPRVGQIPGHEFMLTKRAFDGIYAAAQAYNAAMANIDADKERGRQAAMLIDTQSAAYLAGDSRTVVETSKEIRKMFGLDRPTAIEVNMVGFVRTVDTMSAVLLRFADRLGPQLMGEIADAFDEVRESVNRSIPGAPLSPEAVLTEAARVDPDAWDDQEDAKPAKGAATGGSTPAKRKR